MLLSLMGNIQQKEAVTLRVFCEEYENFIKSNRSNNYYKSVKASLKIFKEYFGHQKVMGSFSYKDIETFISNMQQKIKKGYRVHYRNLKAAFNKALVWEYVSVNYFLKIKLPKKQKTHPAFITESQLKEINKHIENDVVKDFVIIAFYTGMRLSEIINLTWDNVDLTAKIITVGDEEHETKGKNQRYIPISNEALTSILAQGERKCEESNRELCIPKN